jgi:hypothetical protein
MHTVVAPKNGIPSHLHAAGATFFAHMLEDHDIVDAGAVAILTRAAECLDRIATASASIEKDGAIIENQYGTAKLHPTVTLEKAARDGFYAALRMLGIKMNAKGDARDVPWDR